MEPVSIHRDETMTVDTIPGDGSRAASDRMCMMRQDTRAVVSIVTEAGLGIGTMEPGTLPEAGPGAGSGTGSDMMCMMARDDIADVSTMTMAG